MGGLLLDPEHGVVRWPLYSPTILHQHSTVGLTRVTGDIDPTNLVFKEFIMNAKQIFLMSAISLAAAGAMADDITIDNTPTEPSVTRAQVKAEVLRARKAGELIAAGEAIQGGPIAYKSSAARSDVKAQFVAARARGELLAAGEGLSNDAKFSLNDSTLARADVKAQVIAARKAGELLPAGEGFSSDSHTHNQVASTATPLQSIAKVFHRINDTTSQ
jgi:hypothetical protein